MATHTSSIYMGMNTGRNACRGFTLIELIVVMVLLSILTAFAIPGIRTTLFADQLKSTARQLIGLVNEIGQAARSKQQSYFLFFDSESNTFQVQTNEAKSEDEEENQGKERFKQVRVPDGVRVVDIMTAHGGIDSLGDLSIRFSKKGYVDETLIHLSDDDGRDLTLALSPFLGVSRLYDSYQTLEDIKL